MKTSATNKKIRELITGIRDKTLIPRPEFQRRFVWKNLDKVNFIETILKGYPFPEIYIADGDVDLETGSGTQVLVDGQQRIMTLFQYFTGSSLLKIPAHIGSYQSLSPDEQRAFLNYDVATRDLGTVPKAEIIEVFRRINMTSYSLNDMEINNAIYEGELKKYAEFISDDNFFEQHKIFNSTDRRRMGDIRYVLTIIITMITGYFNRDEFLETYLSENNDAFEMRDEIQDRWSKCLSFIRDCQFSETSRVWKKVDFFTFVVELDRILVKQAPILKPKEVSERLEAFFGRVSNLTGTETDTDEAEYYKAVIQASNDRVSRVRRGKIIERILRGKD